MFDRASGGTEVEANAADWGAAGLVKTSHQPDVEAGSPAAVSAGALQNRGS